MRGGAGFKRNRGVQEEGKGHKKVIRAARESRGPQEGVERHEGKCANSGRAEHSNRHSLQEPVGRR